MSDFRWFKNKSGQSKINDIDPYAEIEIDGNEEKDFGPSFLMKLYHLFALFAIPFAGLTFFPIIRDADYLGAVYVMLWISLIYFGILRVVPKKIISDGQGITQEFWLRKTVSIPWNAVISLKVRKGRGTFAILKTNLGNFYLPVEEGGFLESRKLVRIIIHRSPLTFKRGNSLKNALYERV